MPLHIFFKALRYIAAINKLTSVLCVPITKESPKPTDQRVMWYTDTLTHSQLPTMQVLYYVQTILANTMNWVQETNCQPCRYIAMSATAYYVQTSKYYELSLLFYRKPLKLKCDNFLDVCEKYLSYFIAKYNNHYKITLKDVMIYKNSLTKNL